MSALKQVVRCIVEVQVYIIVMVVHQYKTDAIYLTYLLLECVMLEFQLTIESTRNLLYVLKLTIQ